MNLINGWIKQLQGMDNKLVLLIVIVEALVLLLVIGLIIAVKSKHGKVRDLHVQVQAQKRDDLLKRQLSNEYAAEEVWEESEHLVPYKVSYHDEYRGGTDSICVKLTEFGRFSNREYILNVTSVSKIGKAPHNDVVLTEPKASAEDAQLIRQKNRLYLKKSYPTGLLMLQRGRKIYPVESKPILLNDGDMLVIGDTKLEIRFVK